MTEYSDSLPLDNLDNNINPLQPVAETSIPPEKSEPSEPVNKFFNQLESEPVNMNANNTFSVDSVFNANPAEDSNVEIFDIPSNSQPVESPTAKPVDNVPNFENAPISELNPNNKFFQPTNDAVINPMNYVETLDDNFINKQEKAEGVDINSVIGDVRNLISTLQNKGVNIKIEEADLNNSYQITIRSE